MPELRVSLSLSGELWLCLWCSEWCFREANVKMASGMNWWWGRGWQLGDQDLLPSLVLWKSEISPGQPPLLLRP